MNRRQCFDNEKRDQYSKINSNTLSDRNCGCLIPCTQIRYDFRVRRELVQNKVTFNHFEVVSTKFEPNVTTLRINGEKFYVKGNEQRLLYSFEGLLVSVGGFLGLFIGMSLSDVVETVIDALWRLKDRSVK